MIHVAYIPGINIGQKVTVPEENLRKTAIVSGVTLFSTEAVKA